MYLMIMKFLVVCTFNIVPWYNAFNENDGGEGDEEMGKHKTVQGQCNIMHKFTVIKTTF